MRLVALIFALFTASACATPVAAQDTDDLVASCLANAAEPEDRRACIGVASARCIDEPGGETTGGMVICFSRERDLWSAQVTTLTERLRARESPTQLRQLDAMLATHETWVQDRCSYSASIFEGGSLARAIAAACLRTTTAELALDLLERFDEG
jgi:Lysozyme inhibitor LprI